MNWQVGVTAVEKRKGDLLPRTLTSLRGAGFEINRIFADGCDDPQAWDFGCGVTCRGETIKVYGNWVLALGELYFREPHADRYAIFQDDIVCVRNLREYLEGWYPERGYLNLYTFPSETGEFVKRNDKYGWHLSTQRGKGAAGLVLSNDAVRTLLPHPHMVDRPKDPIRGWRLIDGGLVESAKKAGWKEYVHHPSLIQHTGKESSFDKARGGQGDRAIYPVYQWAESTFANPWVGEEYDARKFFLRAT